MRRLLLTAVLAIALFMTVVAPARAITGGQPDGTAHPYAGLILVPGEGFCSGTLISPTVVLTAGHCTAFFDEADVAEVQLSFDPQAAVDEDWEPAGGTWYTASDWVTHPDYVDEDWPFTWDYGLVFLDAPITTIEPAELPEPYLLDDLIGDHGQTAYRFLDVGYGINGVNVGGGPPTPRVTWTRKVAVQRYSPSQGTVGTLDPRWFTLQNAPSSQHGGGCGGDSGSAILPNDPILGDTIVAIHTGRLPPRSRRGHLRSNHLAQPPDRHPRGLAWIQDNL